jgi:uncharacterized protein
VRVNVADLLDDRESARELTFSERFEPPSDDVTLPEPVEGRFTLSGTGETVRLAGRARTVADVVCGACLTRYTQVIEIAVDEEFCRTAPAAEAGQEELRSGDFFAPLESGDVLNVTEVVRQHLVMAVPIAPRCREDCRGLCPHCGADRNTGACRCDERTVDPRLEPLRQWSATTEPTGRIGSRRGTAENAPDKEVRRAPAPPGSRRRKRASGE